MKEWLVTAAGALAIPAILYIFYAAVRTKWPESYVSASEDVGLIINRSVGRYLAFMFLPAYIVALISSTTVNRFGGEAMVCALAGSAIHLGRTQGVHYFRHIARVKNHTRLPSTLVAISVVIGTFGSAALGGMGPGPFPAVVPPIDEFFKSLWTTILVALLAVAVLRVSGDTSSARTLVKKSRREVGEDLLNFARDEAAKAGADPILVEGILLAENLQRPKWVRRLERWKGWFSAEGTYGVMQVHSPIPLTDRASVVRAISEHLRGIKVPRDKWGYYEVDALRRALSKYNSNSDFIEVTLNVIDEIYSPASENKDQAEARSKEERIQERVTLAITVWTEMATRVVAQQEGVVAIAQLPISELRALAELVERLPAPRNPAQEAMKESAQAVLRDADPDRAPTAGRPGM